MARLKGPERLVVEVEEDRPVDLAEARELLRLLRPQLPGLRIRGLSRLKHPEVLSLALIDATKRVAPVRGESGTSCRSLSTGRTGAITDWSDR